jgi:hypothetical protein
MFSISITPGAEADIALLLLQDGAPKFKSWAHISNEPPEIPIFR